MILRKAWPKAPVKQLAPTWMEHSVVKDWCYSATNHVQLSTAKDDNASSLPCMAVESLTELGQ